MEYLKINTDGKYEGYIKHRNEIVVESYDLKTQDFFLLVFLKDGKIEYKHYKARSLTAIEQGDDVNTIKEIWNAENPLIEKYNYDTIKDYIEHGNKTQAEILKYILSIHNEYFKIIEG